LDDHCIFTGEISCAFSDAEGKPMGDVGFLVEAGEILVE
jgi:hypothetical protein